MTFLGRVCLKIALTDFCFLKYDFGRSGVRPRSSHRFVHVFKFGSKGLCFFCIQNEGDNDHTNHFVHKTLASMGGIMQGYFQDVLVLKHIRIWFISLARASH